MKTKDSDNDQDTRDRFPQVRQIAGNQHCPARSTPISCAIIACASDPGCTVQAPARYRRFDCEGKIIPTSCPESCSQPIRHNKAAWDTGRLIGQERWCSRNRSGRSGCGAGAMAGSRYPWRAHGLHDNASIAEAARSWHVLAPRRPRGLRCIAGP
jgi:hypothetical protein